MNTNTTTTTHDIEVGDVFACSWGYDQTNIDYFRVDKVSPKSVEVVAIERIIVEEHDAGTTLAPNPHIERDTALFGNGRNRKRCKVTRRTYSGVDEGPAILLAAGSSWSCTHHAYPVRGFDYDNSKIGR